MDRTVYKSIEGLEGRAPIGAVVTVGTKSSSGYPTDNDRFFIKSPVPDATGGRPLHPEFGFYNSAAAEHRQVIRGRLMHANIRDACAWHLRGYKLPQLESPPSRRPTCEGDGEKATRFTGIVDGQEIFEQIECPNDRCPYRMGLKKPCRPAASVYFRLAWRREKPPREYARWSTHSWNSASNLKGFVEHVEGVALELGLSSFSVFGLPIKLTLTRKTSKAQKTAFPVVQITPDCKLPEFFVAQQEIRKQLGGEVLALPASQYEDDFGGGDLDVDFEEITPGLPGQTANVEPPEAESDAAKPTNGPEPVDAEVVEEPPPLSAQQIELLCKETGATPREIQELVQEMGTSIPHLRQEIRRRQDG